MNWEGEGRRKNDRGRLRHRKNLPALFPRGAVGTSNYFHSEVLDKWKFSPLPNKLLAVKFNIFFSFRKEIIISLRSKTRVKAPVI